MKQPPQAWVLIGAHDVSKGHDLTKRPLIGQPNGASVIGKALGAADMGLAEEDDGG